MISVTGHQGQLILQSTDNAEETLAPMALGKDAIEQFDLVWDKRLQKWTAPAWRYRDVVAALHQGKQLQADHVKQYDKTNFVWQKVITPRPHQKEALQAWLQEGGKGTVVLPTGAGKTVLATLAMASIQRATLIVVPTIDLMLQWHKVLADSFQFDTIGMLGGGSHQIEPVTVATYDSAFMHWDKLWQKFGFVVFDECHHLPAPQYQVIALGLIAPFRLGLTATLERADGKEEFVLAKVGPVVFEARVTELVGASLAPYDVVTLQTDLTEEEQAEYTAARQLYTTFLRQEHVDMRSPNGWQQFVQRAARSPRGRQAMDAFRKQKRIAQRSSNKIKLLWELLQRHTFERIIIFTDDNETAYRIGTSFLLPVLTHHTKPKERKKMLECFRNGQLQVLVTSKVLNEGVDVPEASIGVVLSGSGAVREHVQRLGRILRAQEGKTATLYEIVSRNTSEYYVNARRREHHAYQRPRSH